MRMRLQQKADGPDRPHADWSEPLQSSAAHGADWPPDDDAAPSDIERRAVVNAGRRNGSPMVTLTAASSPSNFTGINPGRDTSPAPHPTSPVRAHEDGVGRQRIGYAQAHRARACAITVGSTRPRRRRHAASPTSGLIPTTAISGDVLPSVPASSAASVWLYQLRRQLRQLSDRGR